MAAASHDRNLLFGILAVQMDFISRDALVAAMHAWVLAKERPLGDILVAQKALAADRRTLLEALVNEHLKQHGGDAEKSLAAVSSVGAVADDLRKIADPGVQASLVHLAARPSVDPDATRAVSVGASTSTGSRFRILRPHARGGLGQVSVARDEELQREVALKEIQVSHADEPDSRARFLLEAEITGGLEHPGIVPVYGLGQYADGRPYYAMRFIRGDSLQEAVARFHASGEQSGERLDSGERAVELRALLGRFIDVCNAIAYAHSRGVLHRDLKPGNIMLGQYGETLVVDWGLAKPQDPSSVKSDSAEGPIRPSTLSGSSPTLMGSAMGTPQYMSPEQAAGRLDLLGPQSDVYSLGATLYCLLTGRPPMEGPNLEVLLLNVQRGEFARPRAVNGQIPVPLEAICLKAMALKPADRYPSPKDLAGDVERWLADEPVSAHREGISAKTARWTRKHKALAASTFALVAIAAVALAVSTVLIKREQLRTEAARQAAQENFQAAETARDQARRRYQLALDAYNDMVFGIQNKLEVRPGTEDLRKDLLENARKGLQKLLQEAKSQGNPDQTLVWTYFKTGDVDRLLGRSEDARQEYADGSDIAAKLAAAEPESSPAQSDLGVSYINLGNIALDMGQTQQALDSYNKALAIRTRRAAADPKDLKAQRGLSVNYELLGDAARRSGQAAEALDHYRKAATIRQQLADADAGNVQAQFDLSVSFERLGDAAVQLGQTKEAFESYQSSKAIRARLAAADPKNAQVQRSLGVSYGKLAEVAQRMDRMTEAADYCRKATELCEQLSEADPKNAQLQRDLEVSYIAAGDFERRQSHASEALDFYRKAAAIGEPLAAADPKNIQLQNDLGNSSERLGDAAVQLSKQQEALAEYLKARDIRVRLAAADPKNAEAQRNLTIIFIKLAGAMLHAGKKDDAFDLLQKSLAIREPVADAEPKNAQAQRDLAFNCEKLGDALRQLDRSKDSLAQYRRAEAIYDRLAEADPQNHAARADLAAGCYEVARGFAHQSAGEDKPASEQDAQQAVAFLQKAVANGFHDLAGLKTEKDFQSLRDRDDYKKLLAEMEKTKA